MSTGERQKHGAVQDTGNPVLDSTVNIVMNLSGTLNLEHIPLLHEAILDLYNKEPKRANPPKRVSLQDMAQGADPTRAVH